MANPERQSLATLYRTANHRAFRAIHYTNSRRQATILGPGPNPEYYVGYYDGSNRLETFDAGGADWVFLASFID